MEWKEEHSKNYFYNPISSDFLYTIETKPTVQVTTRDVLGSCFNFNCEYNISPDLTPTITSSTYNSDRAELTLEITTPHEAVAEDIVEDVKSLADLVFEEINRVRTYPSDYLPILMKYKDGFVKDKDGVTGKNVVYNGETIKTVGGVEAVEKAIKYLTFMYPVEGLTREKNMDLAANDHIKNMGPLGRTGSQG
jgi:hypothetical protein